jgi:tRNA dimethylallyltransferase
MREEIALIVGPTAVGKTKLSLEIAQELGAEIISGDSMQVYKKMDIGTAKPTPEERAKVPHHLIDAVNPEEEFSVAQFQEQADELIPKIVEQGNLPLVVGGTGLYIKALVEGFMFPEMEKDWERRRELEEIAEEKGRDYVHDKLKEIDPERAEDVHPNDLQRTIRALEIYEQTGKTFTYFKQQAQQRPPRYEAVKIGLKRDREKLYERINQRVDKMIAEGLVDEVKELYKAGYDRNLVSMQGLGYKEIIGYLEGEYDLEEAIRLIKRDTRHFAKKQFTWFNRDDSIHWFDLGEYDFADLKTEVEQLIKSEISYL